MGNPNTLSDEAILALYRARNEDAITETDKKYRNYLYAVAHNILVSHEDCEECLSDTYLKTWNAIPPAMPKILRAFLSKITRNAAIDRCDLSKREKRVPPALCDSLSDFEDILPYGRTPEEMLDAKLIGQIITTYLDTVSDRELYLFMSRYYFMMPTKTIATKLRLSQSAVQKQLSKMRQTLREKLEEGGIQL